MRAANQNKTIAYLTLLSVAWGLILFCHAFFPPAQVSAAEFSAKNNADTVSNDTGICDGVEQSQHKKTAPVAPQTQNKNTNGVIPSCCFSKTIPSQITPADPNFSQKTITAIFITTPYPTQPILSQKISSTGLAPPWATQSKTIIKRE